MLEEIETEEPYMLGRVITLEYDPIKNKLEFRGAHQQRARCCPPDY
jgi:hypothetical protein